MSQEFMPSVADGQTREAAPALLDRRERSRIWLVLAALAPLVFVVSSQVGFVDAAPTITMVAGREDVDLNVGDVATDVDFTRAGVPEIVLTAVAPNGDIFITRRNHYLVQKIDGTTGVISTVAGNGDYGFSGDGGPATSAAIGIVKSLAVDAAGQLLILTDTRIRRVSGGNIETIAGNGSFGFPSAGTPAAVTPLNNANSIAVGPAGFVYFATAVQVFRFAVGGNVELVAGNGSIGFGGDGGQATSATLILESFGVAPDGDVYVRNYTRVRKVESSTGVISLYAGGSTVAFGGDGGLATAATLSGGGGIAVDAAAGVFLVDGYRIRRIDPLTLVIDTIAGSGYYGASVDSSGYEVAPSHLAPHPDGGVAAVTPTGLLHVAPDGSPTRLAGVAEVPLTTDAASSIRISAQAAVERSDVDLLVASDDQIVRISGGAVTEIVAGTGVGGYTGDGGQAADARIAGVSDLAVAPDGTIYFSDGSNHVVRAITPAGVIDTVTGSGASGNGVGDLNNPNGLAVGADGSLYIADTSNHRVIKVDPIGVPTVFAGTSTSGFSGDGGAATSAALNAPNDVAISGSSLLIADSMNQRIRQVASGNITTVAGTGSGNAPTVGESAGTQPIGFPTSLVADADSFLFTTNSFSGGLWVEVTTGTVSEVRSLGATSSPTVQPTDAGRALLVGGRVQLIPAGAGPYVWLGGSSGGLGVSGLNGLPALGTYLPITQFFVDDTGLIYAASATVGIASFSTLPGSLIQAFTDEFTSGGMVGRSDDGVVLDLSTKFRLVTDQGSSDLYGTGTCGSTGDGGPAASAQLCSVISTLNANDDITFLNRVQNFPNPTVSSIRRIDGTTGQISTLRTPVPVDGFAGAYEGFAIDNAGVLYRHAATGGGGPTVQIKREQLDNTTTTFDAPFDLIVNLAVDDGGNMFAVAARETDQEFAPDYFFVKITAAGAMDSVAGFMPDDLDVGPDGVLYVSRGGAIYAVTGFEPSVVVPSTTSTTSSSTSTTTSTTSTTVPTPPGPRGDIVPLVPARLLETRAGEKTVDGEFEGQGRVGAGSTVELVVAGRGGVPSDASAVMLNVTAVFPGAPGFVTVFPCGEARPLASHVNYSAGVVVPNAVLAKVGAGGKVCLYTLAATDLLVDVNGYVRSSTS
jgi:sugar lactone lactonase YvrE